jgi:hypothetical protein
MGEHFSVAVRREPMAEGPKLVLKLRVVEDLAVLHHPIAAALVRQRLIAGGEVDDREPRVDHPEMTVGVKAGPVRATMTQLARHGAEQLARSVLPWPTIDSRHTAHASIPPSPHVGCPRVRQMPAASGMPRAVSLRRR